MNTLEISLLITTLLTGLVAGLMYSYEVSIVRGLSNLSDEAYLKAFQSINRVIQNPLFFLSFIGSMLLLPVATWLNYQQGGITPSFYFMLIATVLYGLGVFGVTVAGNVPLNNQLDQFDITHASADAVKNMRLIFETTWNRFHSWRTYASILSFLLTILSIIKKP